MTRTITFVHRKMQPSLTTQSDNPLFFIASLSSCQLSQLLFVLVLLTGKLGATQTKALDLQGMASEHHDVAILGGGCFWCVEAVYNQLKGVQSVVSGYAGGHTRNPTYEQVCSMDTGHAEVVAVTFDPTIISYEAILQVFFTIHDPTTPNRQGADEGPQYRSVIMYRTDQQREAAQRVMRQIADEKLFHAPLVTELVPASTLYQAEQYHQGYFQSNPSQPYCAAVVGPKVAKFRAMWSHLLK